MTRVSPQPDVATRLRQIERDVEALKRRARHDLVVADGTTTVDPTRKLSFTSGATVTDAGSGEADVAVAGGGGEPLIIDYFDNSDYGVGHIAPDTVHGGPGQSSNWVVWSEQANWSGYNSPEPWIAVDDITTGTDPLGMPILQRWVYVPNRGTATDFVTGGGQALIKVEFSMDVNGSGDPSAWYDVTPMRIRGGGPGAWDSPAYGAGVPGNYGWRSDFPVSYANVTSSPFEHRYRPSLQFYDQLSGGIFSGYGFMVYQSLPGGDGDFDDFPYCQLTVTLLKNRAFDGERTS